MKHRIRHVVVGCASVLVSAAGLSAYTGWKYGWIGVCSTLLGAVCVAGFFAVTALLVVCAEYINRQFMLPAALIGFVSFFAVLVAGVTAVSDRVPVHRSSVALSMGISVCAWIIAHSVWVWRLKQVWVSDEK